MPKIPKSSTPCLAGAPRWDARAQACHAYQKHSGAGRRAQAVLKHPPSVHTVPSLTHSKLRRSDLCCTWGTASAGCAGRARPRSSTEAGPVRHRTQPRERAAPGTRPGARDCRLRLGVVPGLHLLPLALLRVAPAALGLVHGERARLVRKVRHMVDGLWKVPLSDPRRPGLSLRRAAAQASAPVQPNACQVGQRAKELTAARGTGRRAHRARVAVGDAVEPAWARAGRLTYISARLKQQPETCRRVAPCHSGGMQVGSCPEGQSRSP